MRFSILLIVLLLIIHNSYSQDYDKVDEITKIYPSHFDNIDQLANRINTDFKLEEEKVRALYNWLALNISYDHLNDYFDIGDNQVIYYHQRYKKRQERIKRLEKLEKVLKYRKAICIDYSQLFNEVCDRIGIACKVIKGYSKVNIYDIESDKKIKNHAWNAVKIGNNWKLIDVTWATVYINQSSKISYKKLSDYYFFTNPKELILTHFPADSKWQLIEDKISRNTFFKSPLLYPSYFIEGIKISDLQKGIIKSHKKKLEILFDEKPKGKKLFYALNGNTHLKPIIFKRVAKGGFVTSIRSNKSHDSQITIYSGHVPIADFKIE